MTRPEIRIPFNRALIGDHELNMLRDAASSGQICGDGPFTARCEKLLQDITGSHRALLTTSCTHALEMCAMLLKIKPGDEVIVPSFTFVSTANAFALHGAKPVFADVCPDTLNIDPEHVLRLISKRTKAIVAVHYAGVACDMDRLMQISEEHGIPLIEDNAHGLLGSFRGRSLGSFGSMATLSFHETKNFTCGEGGALLVNEPAYVERAEIIREKGTDRTQFFRGQVDKYTWRDIGSSYVPSDILAALLFAQLEQRADIQVRRREIWNTYRERLDGWALRSGVRLPTIPPECQQAYHMFYLLCPSPSFRDGLMQHLREHGILSVFHYLPLQVSVMGQQYGGRSGDCPVSEDVSARLLRLPFSNALTLADQEEVCQQVLAFPATQREG